jgi:hypothetical protein
MTGGSVARTAFLVGSGLSSAMGLPRIGEITQQVLSGENVVRHTNGKYYIDKNGELGPADDTLSVRRVLLFLQRLRSEIDSYYRWSVERVANYEDMYFVAGQIADSELRDYENPAIQALIDRILIDVVPAMTQMTSPVSGKWRLDELADSSLTYIRGTVAHLLSKPVADYSPLRVIIDAIGDFAPRSVDVFTLNHDTLLEKFLHDHGIPFVDGFGISDGDVRSMVGP